MKKIKKLKTLDNDLLKDKYFNSKMETRFIILEKTNIIFSDEELLKLSVDEILRYADISKVIMLLNTHIDFLLYIDKLRYDGKICNLIKIIKSDEEKFAQFLFLIKDITDNDIEYLSNDLFIELFGDDGIYNKTKTSLPKVSKIIVNYYKKLHYRILEGSEIYPSFHINSNCFISDDYFTKIINNERFFETIDIRTINFISIPKHYPIITTIEYDKLCKIIDQKTISQSECLKGDIEACKVYLSNFLDIKSRKEFFYKLDEAFISKYQHLIFLDNMIYLNENILKSNYYQFKITNNKYNFKDYEFYFNKYISKVGNYYYFNDLILAFPKQTFDYIMNNLIDGKYNNGLMRYIDLKNEYQGFRSEDDINYIKNNLDYSKLTENADLPKLVFDSTSLLKVISIFTKKKLKNLFNNYKIIKELKLYNYEGMFMTVDVFNKIKKNKSICKILCSRIEMDLNDFEINGTPYLIEKYKKYKK